MQHRYTFSLPLSKITPELEEYILSIRTVHPEFTLGGYLIRNKNNFTQLFLCLPRLQKKQISFKITKDEKKLIHRIKFYNIICSLQSCILEHEITEAKKLKISIIADPETAKDIEKLAKKAELEIE